MARSCFRSRRGTLDPDFAVRHMLADDTDYADLCGDYFARLDPERSVCDASSAKPTRSGLPCASTPSRPPEHPVTAYGNTGTSNHPEPRLTIHFRTSARRIQ